MKNLILPLLLLGFICTKKSPPLPSMYLPPVFDSILYVGEEWLVMPQECVPGSVSVPWFSEPIEFTQYYNLRRALVPVPANLPLGQYTVKIIIFDNVFYYTITVCKSKNLKKSKAPKIKNAKTIAYQNRLFSRSKINYLIFVRLFLFA